MSSAQAAWVQPSLAAAGAAAGVLQQASEQGAFTLPAGLSGLLGALAPKPSTPPATSRIVDARVPPPEAPAPGPWTISGILGRIKERPVVAAGIAAGVALVAWLIFRKG